MPGGGLMQLVAYGAQDVYLLEPSPKDDSHEKTMTKVKKNKLKDKKCISNECNICYDNLEVYKCNKCIYLVCESCYIKTKDYKCVHCKDNF